jgi:hypothetical protein
MAPKQAVVTTRYPAQLYLRREAVGVNLLTPPKAVAFALQDQCWRLQGG